MTHAPPRLSYRLIGTFALTLAAIPWMSCLETESVHCSSGMLCPDGQTCAANQAVCIKTPCGNGVVDIDEACDDGNIKDGDGCSRDCSSDESCGNRIVDLNIGEVCDDGNQSDLDGCSANCRSSELCGNGITDYSRGEVCDDKNLQDGDGCSANCRSDETCGNGKLDVVKHEACDDGNNVSGDGCSADCKSGEGCGNNTRDPGEECDDGNLNNDDGCVEINNRCLIARCGDGLVNRHGPEAETCDDGNNISEVSCPYDVRTCTHCSGDCRTVLALTGPYCGDGVRNGNEACDDGNNVTESSCTYGTPRCTACSAACTAVLNLTGAFCGDGRINDNGSTVEACDDGNTDSCGTCAATCNEKQLAAAHGRITVGSAPDIRDMDRLILSDGISGAPVIFEFDRNDITDGSFRFIRLAATDSNNLVASRIVAAINAVGETLRITAYTSNANVILDHDLAGEFGNQPISTQIAPEVLSISGMNGGAGANCGEGIGCMRKEDCKPHLICRANKTCGPP